MGEQVVKISADLLHSQFEPPASDNSIGGDVLTGFRTAAPVTARNAIMTKCRFMAVLQLGW